MRDPRFGRRLSLLNPGQAALNAGFIPVRDVLDPSGGKQPQ